MQLLLGVVGRMLTKYIQVSVTYPLSYRCLKFGEFETKDKAWNAFSSNAFSRLRGQIYEQIGKWPNYDGII